VKVDIARIHRHAGALANRRGLDGLSMNELAQALGVRTPSLYSHVAGIDSVKRALALNGLAELEREAARATIGRSGPDAVRALLHGYRKFVRKNPGIYAATVASPPRDDPELRAAADRLTGTCVAALQGYGLAEREAIHALRAVRSLVHGFASLEAAGALQHPVDRDESFAWLVEALIAMLEARSARHTRPRRRTRK
jgi:AcrR family transcriptional regulator